MRLGAFFEIFAQQKRHPEGFTNYDLQHKEYPAGDEQRADEYAQGNFLV